MRVPIFLASVALAFLTVATAADTVVGGPFVVNVGPKTATVVWVVQSDRLTLTTAGAPARVSPSLRVEKTTLTGLQPNTRYEYDASDRTPERDLSKLLRPPMSPTGLWSSAIPAAGTTCIATWWKPC